METTARGTGGLCGETAAQQRTERWQSLELASRPSTAAGLDTEVFIPREGVSIVERTCRRIGGRGSAALCTFHGGQVASRCTFHGGKVAAEEELEGEDEG